MTLASSAAGPRNGEAAVEDGPDTAELARKMAGSAMSLGLRRGLITIIGALGTAVVARFLGPDDYGQLAAAVASWGLAMAAGDFGFSMLLGRELARRPRDRGRIIRAVRRIQVAWSLVLSGVLAGIACLDLGSVYGQCLLVLAPSVAVGGLLGAREIFLVIYRTSQAVRIDVLVTLVQVALMLAAVALGAGPVAVAGLIALGTTVNIVWLYVLAMRIVDDGRPEAGDLRAMVGKALPIGIMAFASKVYFTVDLVICAWLVSGSSLGDYAAASKILALLVTVSAFVMSGALPGLSSSAASPAELAAVTTRVWHWLVATGLPLCAGTALFAEPIVRLVFGSEFRGAVSLVRILSLAAAIALLGTILGHVLVARGRLRPAVTQNLVAIGLNAGGNLLLVPRVGVVASAWLTVATEAFVCLAALWLLRGTLPLRRWVTVSVRPVAALGVAIAAGAVLLAWPAAGLAAAVVVFGVLVLALKGWPAELMPARFATKAS